MQGGIDIDNRAKKFAVRIIKMSSTLPRSQAGYVLGNQITRSGTSVGANIVEAQSSSTKKEFVYKLNISLNEARETSYWLDLIIESGLIKRERLELLIQENNEIIKILVTIIKNTKARNKSK